MYKILIFLVFLATNSLAQVINPKLSAEVSFMQPDISGKVLKERIVKLTFSADNGRGKSDQVTFKENMEGNEALFVYAKDKDDFDKFKIKKTITYEIELPKERAQEVYAIVNRITKEKDLRDKGTSKKEAIVILQTILGSYGSSNKKPFESLQEFFVKYK